MAGKRPVFTYAGKQYRPGDLTGREVEQIERITGVKYVAHDPCDSTTGEIRDMGHALAYMTVFLSKDMAPEVVDAFINDTSVTVLDTLWSVEDEDLPDAYQDGIPLVDGPSTLT